MDLKLILESLLFVAQKPLSPSEVKEVLGRTADEEGADEATRSLKRITSDTIEECLHALAADHAAAARSYRLVCVAGSWQFVTQPEFAPWLRVMIGVKTRPARLSQPGLETLAIVAYRQPITRAEIEQIRGVAVDGVIATLLERGLIAQAGRAEVVGRPMTYATTPAFLEYFGLASLEALPAADELRRIPVQRPETLVTADAAPPESPSEPDSPASASPGDPGTAPAPATPTPEGK